MSDIQDYKCPSCGAPIVFKADSQAFVCDSCDSSFTSDVLQQLSEYTSGASIGDSYSWDNYTPRNYDDVSVNLADYSCPSCGAVIAGEESLGASQCPYCGNNTIVREQFSGTLQPDFIIPFKEDKNEAFKLFEKTAKKVKFLATGFLKRCKKVEMMGLYVPYWMFDSKCNASAVLKGEKVRRYSTSTHNVVETSYYKLLRGGKMSFQGIPVDGNSAIEAEYSEAIEPYDYSQAVSFNSAYLSGFYANKYDVSLEDSIQRANERIKSSMSDFIKDSASEYSNLHIENLSVNSSEGKTRYALLPIWFLTLKYKGNLYKYAINGQTGKVVGSYPTDKWKFLLLGLFYFVLSFSVLVLGRYLYLITYL